jgi:integrase
MAIFTRNGEYWIDYYYHGHRYRHRVSGRKKDAEEALSRVRVSIASGEFTPPDERKAPEEAEKPPTLKEYTTNDYLPWSETHHSESHHKLQESILRTQLLPRFGKHHLDEISQKMLEDFVTARSRSTYARGKQKRPVKATTVNRDIACMKILFRKAAEWGLIEYAPARPVKMLKETPNPPRLLTPKEVSALIEAMPDHQKAMIICVVYAGLRRGELFHLRWRDVDLKQMEINVVSRDGSRTKSGKSRRIPLSPVLAEALRRHPRHITSQYVFCNPEGKPYDNITKSLKAAAQRAGIEDGVKLHQLRHCFLSYSQMQGVDPRTAQKWAGHSSLATTLKDLHVSPDHEKAAIGRLNYG